MWGVLRGSYLGLDVIERDRTLHTWQRYVSPLLEKPMRLFACSRELKTNLRQYSQLSPLEHLDCGSDARNERRHDAESSYSLS